MEETSSLVRSSREWMSVRRSVIKETDRVKQLNQFISLIQVNYLFNFIFFIF